jgi:hypothetical protein
MTLITTDATATAATAATVAVSVTTTTTTNNNNSGVGGGVGGGGASSVLIAHSQPFHFRVELPGRRARALCFAGRPGVWCGVRLHSLLGLRV